MLCDTSMGTAVPIKRLKLAAGETLRLNIAESALNLPPAGLLNVTVLTRQGLPLLGAQVWLEGRETTIKPTLVHDERCEFSGKPGDYALHAAYPGYRESRQSVTLRALTPGAGDKPWPTAQVRLERE